MHQAHHHSLVSVWPRKGCGSGLGSMILVRRPSNLRACTLPPSEGQPSLSLLEQNRERLPLPRDCRSLAARDVADIVHTSMLLRGIQAMYATVGSVWGADVEEYCWVVPLEAGREVHPGHAHTSPEPMHAHERARTHTLPWRGAWHGAAWRSAVPPNPRRGARTLAAPRGKGDYAHFVAYLTHQRLDGHLGCLLRMRHALAVHCLINQHIASLKVLADFVPKQFSPQCPLSPKLRKLL